MGIGFLASCGQSGVSMDPAARQSIIDSLIQTNSESIKDSISQACEQRMKTDVITMADSIVNAAKASK